MRACSESSGLVSSSGAAPESVPALPCPLCWPCPLLAVGEVTADRCPAGDSVGSAAFFLRRSWEGEALAVSFRY